MLIFRGVFINNKPPELKACRTWAKTNAKSVSSAGNASRRLPNLDNASTTLGALICMIIHWWYRRWSPLPVSSIVRANKWIAQSGVDDLEPKICFYNSMSMTVSSMFIPSLRDCLHVIRFMSHNHSTSQTLLWLEDCPKLIDQIEWQSPTGGSKTDLLKITNLQKSKKGCN